MWSRSLPREICVARTVGSFLRSSGRLARYYGSPRAVASTSGTAAIHVALAALGLNPGDEVVTTPLTDMGSVIPILACNCLPVFADVDPETGNLTAETIERKLTPRTRAVVLVHLFGRPADLGPICELLRDRKIALIEDCSQAHDAEYQGKKVGTFGDFGTFSFQQSKQITCGDGGITLVNRPELAERAALFADKGWDRKRGARSHLFLGMNYRMTELQGAVVLRQLERLPGLIKARRATAESLADELRSIRGVVPPPEQAGVDPSWWMFAFRIDEEKLGVSTAEFGEALAVEGVPVRRAILAGADLRIRHAETPADVRGQRISFHRIPVRAAKHGRFSGLPRVQPERSVSPLEPIGPAAPRRGDRIRRAQGGEPAAAAFAAEPETDPGSRSVRHLSACQCLTRGLNPGPLS